MADTHTDTQYSMLKKLFQSMSGEQGKRWARPEEPIYHNVVDERAEPHIFFHNANYRISRKYINIEKYTVCVGGGLQPLAYSVALHFVCSTLDTS